MAFCTKCGATIKDTARFCQKCGSPRDVPNETTESTRKVVYDGVVHKCPNCGEVLKAFMVNCPTCGYELRGSASSESVKEFSRKYESLDDYKKVELIKSYTIPNTREDILEFIILASSNITSNAMDDEEGVYIVGATPQDINNAWMIKFEQAYHKAGLVLQGDPYLEKVEKIYKEKKETLKKSEQNANKKKVRSKFKNFMLWTGWLWGFGILIAIITIPHAIKVHKLDNLVEEIEELISEEKYDAALLKTEKLHCDDGYSKESTQEWEDIREAMVLRIEKLQGNFQGQAKVPTIDLEEDDYQEAIRLFKKSGFNNVIAIKSDDVANSWRHTEGEIEEILINGKNNIAGGSYVDSSSEIIIKYYTMSNK